MTRFLKAKVERPGSNGNSLLLFDFAGNHLNPFLKEEGVFFVNFRLD